MKVSLEWLRTFVPIRLPVETLAERLAMGGLEVIGVEKKDGDTLLEMEITPNRPDLLSHVGVAREIAALTGMRLKHPAVSRLSFPSAKTGGHSLAIAIQDKKGCERYIGRLLSGARIAPSPSWMRDRLERLGLRAINNVVDITNYVLLEEGQPLHAFDYDRIAGGKVVIRSARKGETLRTMDGNPHPLREEDLVIADAEKPIALAGIIGGRETEITPETRRVLLESAYFDPTRVRRTAKRLGLSTESSYRFERGVSLEGVWTASLKAAHLLVQETGARPLVSIDQGKNSFPRRTLSLSLQTVHQTLGIAPPSSQTRRFLSSLGCRVRGQKILRVTPPAFRRDLREAADLVEEIGRLFGYDRIPVTIPLRERVPIEQETPPLSRSRQLEAKVRDSLVSQGLFEVVTYSLLSRSCVEAFFGENASAIPIQNPLSLEQELLRPSLLPRLVEVAAYNHRRQAEGIPIFEIGPVYEKAGNRTLEKKHLAILLSGNRPGNWKAKSASYDYFDLKGSCEAILAALSPSREPSYEKSSVPFLTPSDSFALGVDGERLGVLGELAPSPLRFFDLKGRIYVAELDLSKGFTLASPEKKFLPLPKFPSVRRDIALIAKADLPSETLARTIRDAGGAWVKSVSLFDAYSDPRIVPKGSRGLAYRVEFLHPERTLTDEEVHGQYQAILDALKHLGVQIRIGAVP